MRTIQIELKTLAGQDVATPACETSKALARLARRERFTADDLRAIRRAGYSIRLVDRRTQSQLLAVLAGG